MFSMVGINSHRSDLSGRRRATTCQLMTETLDSTSRLHDEATGSVGLRRDFKLGGLGIDDGTQRHHSGASDEVVCALSATAGQLRCLLALRHELADGRSRLAGKALHSLKTLCYPLSTLPWDLGAKRSLGSDKVAPWFSG